MLFCGWIHSSGQTVSIKLSTLNLLIEYAERSKIDSLIIESKNKELVFRDSIEVKKDSMLLILKAGLTSMTLDRNNCGRDLQIEKNKTANQKFVIKVLSVLAVGLGLGLVFN